jgi:hypothetical protein
MTDMAASTNGPHPQQAGLLFCAGISGDPQNALHIDWSLDGFKPPRQTPGRLQHAARVQRPDLCLELRVEQLRLEPTEEIFEIADVAPYIRCALLLPAASTAWDRSMITGPSAASRT